MGELSVAILLVIVYGLCTILSLHIIVKELVKEGSRLTVGLCTIAALVSFTPLNLMVILVAFVVRINNWSIWNRTLTKIEKLYGRKSDS